MARYDTTIASRLAPAETFSYLATFSNAARWDPSVAESAQLDPGPVRLGTRFRLTVKLAGQPLRLTYRITRYNPPGEVVLEALNWLLTSVDQITVDGRGDAAQVCYKATVRLRGPLKLLDPLLAAGFARTAARAAAGLTRALSEVPAGDVP